jgi:hypothetical protein
VKISRTTWICLVAGIFIIAGISLGMARSQQTDRQQQLQDKLTQANLSLSQIKVDELIEKKETLTSQIGSYEAQTAETLAILAYSKDSIDVTAEVLAEAKKQGVDIDEISSPGTSTEVLDGNTCETLQLNLRVAGDIRNISDFVCGLSKTFPTSVIKSVQIDIKQPSAESSPKISGAEASGMTEQEDGDSNNTAVSINMVIYNFKGKM